MGRRLVGQMLVLHASPLMEGSSSGTLPALPLKGGICAPSPWAVVTLVKVMPRDWRDLVIKGCTVSSLCPLRCSLSESGRHAARKRKQP